MQLLKITGMTFQTLQGLHRTCSMLEMVLHNLEPKIYLKRTTINIFISKNQVLNELPVELLPYRD
jgi:hypothetical protein